MNFLKIKIVTILIIFYFTHQGCAYALWKFDESKVADYILPDPLILSNGKAVANADDWWKNRRPQLLDMFENEMFGKTPKKHLAVQYQVTSSDNKALGGKATRKEITVTFAGASKVFSMAVLMYIPNNAPRTVPDFLGMNFDGNQSIINDTAIDKSNTKYL